MGTYKDRFYPYSTVDDGNLSLPDCVKEYNISFGLTMSNNKSVINGLESCLGMRFYWSHSM